MGEIDTKFVTQLTLKGVILMAESIGFCYRFISSVETSAQVLDT